MPKTKRPGSDHCMALSLSHQLTEGRPFLKSGEKWRIMIWNLKLEAYRLSIHPSCISIFRAKCKKTLFACPLEKNSTASLKNSTDVSAPSACFFPTMLTPTPPGTVWHFFWILFFLSDGGHDVRNGIDHNDGQFFRAMEWLMFFF